ncbi:MAG: shikimate dehydrogenase [bacterium]|nr:shikimate dehydrogenase [bacterium]
MALVGHPVHHSWSPGLHAAALAHAGLEGRYDLLDVPPGALAPVLDRMRSGAFDGLNVTLPHKVEVVSGLDGLTEEAALVGAVNTVFRDGDRLLGDNTDVPALVRCLEGTVPDEALVLGAGGAARAAVVAIARRGVGRIHVVARTPSRIASWVPTLAPVFPSTRVDVVSLEALESLLPRAGWFVQATPVGMAPHGDLCPLEADPLDRLPGSCIVHDLVYHPDPTVLVRKARERGLEAHGGGRMLAFQAREAFRRWTGREVPDSIWLEALRQRALRVI